MDEGYFKHITEHPELSVRDVEIIERRAPAARWIIDVGCGRGGFVEICRRKFEGALGLDNEPASARICRAQGVPFILGEGQQIPFVDGCLDVVRAKEIIEHLQDPRPLLREIWRALRPDGLLLAHVPSAYSALYPIGNFWDDYTHVRPLSQLGLRRLLEDTGFAAERISGYTAGRNAPERVLGRLLALVVPHTWLAVARKAEGLLSGQRRVADIRGKTVST